MLEGCRSCILNTKNRVGCLQKFVESVLTTVKRIGDL